MTVNKVGIIVSANHSVKVLPFIMKDDIRFGLATTAKSSSDQFASVVVENVHFPCKILYHFKVHIPHQETLLSCFVLDKRQA